MSRGLPLRQQGVSIVLALGLLLYYKQAKGPNQRGCTGA